jgi:branched-chain amino acid transport system permease protein
VLHTALLLAYDPEAKITAPVITGVIQGCVYGLIGLGLVLVYKSNKFFTFVQAEIATVAAFAGSLARDPKGGTGNFVVACLVGILTGVIVGLLTQVLVIRPLFRASRITLTVATVGVALVLIQGELLVFGANAKRFAPLVRGTGEREGVSLLATSVSRVSWSQMVLVLFFVAAGLMAAAFFRTRYGTGILAVSQEPTAASTVGINVMRVSLLTWGLVGLLAGIAGVAYAPVAIQVTPGLMTVNGPLVGGFVAAVVGGMTSLPGAFAGGLTVGLVEQLANANQPSGISGFKDLVVFGMLLLVLLVRPKGLLGKEA